MNARYLLPLATLALAFAPAAHATVISGSIYCNVSNAIASNTPVPGSAVTSGSLCATFQSSAINFNNYSGGQNTIGQFLNSNNLILGSVNYQNGFSASSNLDFSVFQFTGLGYFQNGQTYSATHDDGTVMAVNGTTVINLPSPTGARTDSFTWTGASGNYNFAYNYTEVQGASVYSTNATNSPVPEPTPGLLVGTGLATCLFLSRHKLRVLAS